MKCARLLAATLAAAAALCALPRAAAHAPSSSEPRTSQGVRSRVSSAPASAYAAPAAAAAAAAAAAGAAAPAAALAAFPSAAVDGGNLNITLLSLAGAAVSPDDFISLTCGEVVAANDFFDAVTLNDVASGEPVSIVFASLPFLRCEWNATYWSTVYSPTLSWVAAGSILVPNAEPRSTPKQVHLGYLGVPTTMSAAWVSGGPLAGEQRVRWGPRGNATLSASAPATSATYAASDLCGAPANVTCQVGFRDPGLLHNATLAGLVPGARYDYQVGSDEDGWSAVFSFKAAPAPGTPVKFAAYGDQSLVPFAPAAANSSLKVAAAAAADRADFCLVNGDLGYAMGSAWIWDSYMQMVQPAAATTPHLWQIGNHECVHSGLGAPVLAAALPNNSPRSFLPQVRLCGGRDV
jgi:hypothetical protein